MRILTVILLLSVTHTALNSPLLLANEVRVEGATQIISDEEYTKLIYNKSALLVRRKRENTALRIAVLTDVLSYACFIAIDATAFRPYLKSLLQYWGFREGHADLFWKSLALVVNTNVHLDDEGFIHKKKGIGNFLDAPPELIGKIQEFREEAAQVIAKKLEEEKKEEARMLTGKEKNKAIGIDEHSLSEHVKIPEDLNQMSKAIMADSMIDTLIGKNAMGETTWKYNPNNNEHRILYEGLQKAKSAIDAKYRNKCELKEITADELPAYKSLLDRTLGPIPTWATNLFMKFSNIPKIEPKAEVIDGDLAKTMATIQGMLQEVILNIKKDTEEARVKAKQSQEGIDQAKVNRLFDVGPSGTKTPPEARKVGNRRSAQESLQAPRSAHNVSDISVKIKHEK